MSILVQGHAETKREKNLLDACSLPPGWVYQQVRTCTFNLHPEGASLVSAGGNKTAFTGVYESRQDLIRFGPRMKAVENNPFPAISPKETLQKKRCLVMLPTVRRNSCGPYICICCELGNRSRRFRNFQSCLPKAANNKGVLQCENAHYTHVAAFEQSKMSKDFRS